MKKFILVLLVMSMVLSLNVGANTKSNETVVNNESTFNLIETLESNETVVVNNESTSFSTVCSNAKINSVKDFEEVLREYVDKNNVKDDSNNFIFGESESIILNKKYKLHIDKKSKTVNLIETLESNDETETLATSKGTAYTKTITSKGYTYDRTGRKAFTVELQSKWQYDNKSYAKTVWSKEYFYPAVASMWNSIPSVTDSYRYEGQIYAADCYGTAELDLAIAEKIGIEINIQTVKYNLSQLCSWYGTPHTIYETKVVK